MRWLVIVAALTACSLSTGPASASGSVAAGAGTEVLIFCDYTPGTVPLMVAIKAGLTAENRPATVVSEPADFVTELERREWPDVLVLSRHAAAEPPYAAALRKYANRHPSAPVTIWMWHDGGQEPVRGTAVFADGAWAVWRYGATSIAYVAKGAPPASSMAGQVFPNFAGLEIQEPAVVEQIKMTPERAALGWALLFVELAQQFNTECEREAYAAYVSRIVACNDSYNLHVSLCDQTYPEPRPPAQAAQWQACMQEAAEGRTNCYRSALNIYRLQYELCQL